jgi:glycosyltransferase involved in cell wall biosynthesis
LFTDNDQASGGGVLQRLLASPGLIRDAGANARRRAESLFSSERMVDDYLRLYRDVLGRRAGSGVGTA